MFKPAVAYLSNFIYTHCQQLNVQVLLVHAVAYIPRAVDLFVYTLLLFHTVQDTIHLDRASFCRWQMEDTNGR